MRNPQNVTLNASPTVVGIDSRRISVDPVLDLLPYGVFLVGLDGLPNYMNLKAASILESPGGLALSRGGLTAESHNETLLLRTMIRRAIESSQGKNNYGGGTMLIGRGESGDELQVLITPLRPNGNRGFKSDESAAIAIFVTVTAQKNAYPVNQIMSLFGLTHAEAKLMRELANGLSLEQICDRFEITKHTARAQLRSLFDKTGVSRQAELVKMVLTSPVPLLVSA